MSRWLRVELAVILAFGTCVAIASEDFTEQQKALLQRFTYINWSRWQLVYIDDASAVAIDTATIQRLSSKQRRFIVWLSWMYAEDQPLGYLVPKGVNTYVSDFSEARQKTELRCTDGELAILQQTLYRRGEFVEQLGPWAKKQWHAPVPQTVEEDVLTKTCSYLQKNHHR